MSKLPDKMFFQLLSGAFFYPIRGQGVFVLLVGAFFFEVAWLLTIVPLAGWILGIFLLFYYGAFMLEIMTNTAAGKDQLPYWPDISRLWENIFRPCVLALLTVLFSAVPLIAVGVVAGVYDWEPDWWVWLGAGIVSGLYWPMSLLAVSLSDRLLAMNPAIILPAIARVPFKYLVACAVLVVIVWFNMWIGNPPIFVRQFAGLYLGALQMRILGLIYYVNRHDLGWFE